MNTNKTKRKYMKPAMQVFELRQQPQLLQSSDGDKTPVIHGPIGYAPGLSDEKNNLA